MRARQVAAAVAAGIFLLPVVVMVLGALHPHGEPLPTGFRLIPTSPTTASLARAFDLEPLGRQLANSATVVLVAVPVSVLVASWAGFAMTLLTGRAQRLAVGVALVLLVVPASTVWTPRFVLLSRAGLVDSLVPLMLPALMGTTPFAVLLFYWGFRRVPRELLDAGRLAGLGPLGLWLRVASPLVRSTTVAVAAIVFVAHWGNFVDALLYLYSPESFTLPLGMSQLRLLGAPDQSTVLAGALVVTVPALIAFAAVQHRFVSAMKETSWLGS